METPLIAFCHERQGRKESKEHTAKTSADGQDVFVKDSDVYLTGRGGTKDVTGQNVKEKQQ